MNLSGKILKRMMALVAVLSALLIVASATPASAVSTNPFVGIHIGDDNGYVAEKVNAGPVTVARVFIGGIQPTSITSADLITKVTNVSAGAVAANMAPFVSVKFQPGDVLAGKLDPQLKALAKWFGGNNYTTLFTSWHEPENDFYTTSYPWRPIDFVHMYNHMYTVMKPLAGSKMLMAPVYQAYNWRPSCANAGANTVCVSDAEATTWRVPAADRDFLGMDVYSTNNSESSSPNNVTPTTSLDQHKPFQRWLQYINGGSLHGVVIVERGISRYYAGHPEVSADSQALTIRADYDYLTAGGAAGYMYWNSGGASDGSDFTLNARSYGALRTIAYMAPH